MEEDLKILDKYLEKYEREYVSKEKHELLQAIENLLQAYKQDEKVIHEMVKCIFKNVDINVICRTINSDDCFTRKDCKSCIIDYFRKRC